MTTPTFTPPRAPSLESNRDVKPRVLVASFGDGYTQRAPDGINSVEETINVVWTRLTPADAETIRAFFEGTKGASAFFWTAPRDTAPKKWIAVQWSTSYPTQIHETIRASFRQVFDL